MNKDDIRNGISHICEVMDANKQYLVELDQQNGDGDLGISMCAGFHAVYDYLTQADETDLGKLMMKCASNFNEAAPSSLGTILSFCFMGMAKALKGKTEMSFPEFANAFMDGVNRIMEKAKSKPGEKTVLDSLYPGAEALINNSADPALAVKLAAKAAYDGSEATRNMIAVHGRAAYYGEKSIGVLDGGSVAGRLIFEGIARC